MPRITDKAGRELRVVDAAGNELVIGSKVYDWYRHIKDIGVTEMTVALLLPSPGILLVTRRPGGLFFARRIRRRLFRRNIYRCPDLIRIDNEKEAVAE